MQGMMYVFLKRDLETDSARMSRAVDYYADMGRPYQVVVYNHPFLTLWLEFIIR